MRDSEVVEKLEEALKSNPGHKGRPGKVGGSYPKGGGVTASNRSASTAEKLSPLAKKNRQLFEKAEQILANHFMGGSQRRWYG